MLFPAGSFSHVSTPKDIMTIAAAESIGLSAVMLSKLEFLLKFAVAASTSNGPVGVKAPPPKNVNASLTISLN